MMANKWLVCVFGAFLLVPTYNAAPLTSSEELQESAIKAFLERILLLGLTFQEYTHIFDEVLNGGPPILEAVVNDPKVLAIKTAEMENNLNEIRSLLSKFKDLKISTDMDESFVLVEEISEIFSKYDGEKQKLNAEGTAIENSMKEHGMPALESTLLKHFEKFFNTFTAQADKYINGLNENEKSAEKEFLDWYNKFKAEKDTEKKIELFTEIVEGKN